MTPQEAYERYEQAERTANEEYRDYWMDKFKRAGIKFTASQYYGWFDGEFFNRYGLSAAVRPAVFNGMKVRVHYGSTGSNLDHTLQPDDRWHWIKVKSDTGFNKLVHRLKNKQIE